MWRNFQELGRFDRPRRQHPVERPMANQDLVNVIDEVLTLHPRQSLRALAKRQGKK